MRPRPYTCARLSLEGDAAGNVFRRLGRVSTVSASSLAVCCRSGDDVAEAVRCGLDRVGEGRGCAKGSESSGRVGKASASRSNSAIVAGPAKRPR